MKWNRKKPIVLCGFMGSGKTYVGKELANVTKRRFYDLDEIIEMQEGLSIPEIFSRFGEDYFRDIEHRCFKKYLISDYNSVISTGGGVLTIQRNIDLVNNQALVVYINTNFGVCYSRIRNSSRPLVQQKTAAELKETYQKRDFLYLSCADITAKNNLYDDGAVRWIMKQLKNNPH